jgi:hypothetical protein
MAFSRYRPTRIVVIEALAERETVMVRWFGFRACEDVVITRSAVGIGESLFHQCFETFVEMLG